MEIEYEIKCKESGCKAVPIEDKVYSYYCPKSGKRLFKHEVYKFVSLFAKLKQNV